MEYNGRLMAIRDDFEIVASQVRVALQRFALALLVIAAFGAMLIGKADTVLVENARATYAEIGGRVGLSAPAVKRRVDRLRATGAITGFSARVNPAALGWTTEAYVELFCRGRTSPADIGAAVSKYPEVTGAATITGEADALLHIRAADVRHFERVVERISAEPFVVRTRSVIVLSRLVSRAGFLPSGAGGPGEPDVPCDLPRNGDSG